MKQWWDDVLDMSTTTTTAKEKNYDWNMFTNYEWYEHVEFNIEIYLAAYVYISY
jgi:hypothetical protein